MVQRPTQFHELHGREDGRGRTFIFLQMGILAVVAVYAPHATSGDGDSFAWAYAVLLAVQAYQWWSVLRIDHGHYRPVAVRYLAAMCAGIGLIVVSALVVDDDLRLGLWALVVGGAIGLGLAPGLVTPLTDSAPHVARRPVGVDVQPPADDDGDRRRGCGDGEPGGARARRLDGDRVELADRHIGFLLPGAPEIDSNLSAGVRRRLIGGSGGRGSIARPVR